MTSSSISLPTCAYLKTVLKLNAYKERGQFVLQAKLQSELFGPNVYSLTRLSWLIPTSISCKPSRPIPLMSQNFTMWLSHVASPCAVTSWAAPGWSDELHSLPSLQELVFLETRTGDKCHYFITQFGSHSASSSPFGIISSKPNSEQTEWEWIELILRGGVLGIHGLSVHRKSRILGAENSAQ